MINIYANYCQESGCDITATFNYEGETIGKFCTSHKKPGMINVKDKLCKTNLCHTVVKNKNYKGYCLRCFIHMFPDKPVVRNYKTKERAVAEYIFEHFSNEKYTWITDQKIENGCSSKRPDLLLDLGYQVIVVEIDENQHQSYECSCENKRLMLISQDIGHRPLIFIRFNPDDYITKDGRISSCWKINKTTGLINLDLKRIKEWDERINILVEQINYWINHSTEKTVEIIELFY
jgi:hypothetical protein